MCETKRVAKMFFFNEVEKAKRTVGKLEKLKETPHRPRLGKLILKSKATGSGSGRLQWQVAVAGGWYIFYEFVLSLTRFPAKKPCGPRALPSDRGPTSKTISNN